MRRDSHSGIPNSTGGRIILAVGTQEVGRRGSKAHWEGQLTDLHTSTAPNPNHTPHFGTDDTHRADPLSCPS